MIHRLLLLALIFTSALSCGAKKTDDASTTGAANTETHFLPPNMTFLTSEDVSRLHATATSVDIIFYNHPVSVSQEEESSVKNTVQYIIPSSPTVSAKCGPLGRLAWLADGVILREADIFMGNGCNYLLFMENNQPVAANAMALEGVQFFTNIISQVNQRQQQMQQPQSQ